MTDLSQSIVRAGLKYSVDRGQDIIRVIRVARDGSWADIVVHQVTTGARWSKRMPLPFPESWERVE